MPLPSQVSTASVLFGQAVSFTGKAVELHLTISPTHRVIHAASGTSLVPLHETYVARAGEQIMVALPHTDQPGFTDANGYPFTGWAYDVSGVWKDGSSVAPFRKTFQVLRGQTTVDFDLIPDEDVAPPTTAARQVVTSVNGQSGAVTLAVGGGATGVTKEAVDRAQSTADAAGQAAAGAATAAASAATAATGARTAASDASTRAGQAVDAIAAAERRIDAFKPGQPGGVVVTDGSGRIPASVIPPLPGAGLVIVPLAGHPRYLTLVQ